MTREHLTDEELQQFVSDSSITDPVLVAHVHSCSECKAKVETYQLLFSGLKDQQAPSFDFDLEELVLNRLQPVRQASSQLQYFLVAIGLIFSGVILFIFRDWLVVAKGLLVFMALISAVPILVFLSAEEFKSYTRKMEFLEV